MTTTAKPDTTTTGPPPSRTRRVVDAVDERLGIKALEYAVPEHANNLAWSLGGITAGAIIILIITGVLLVQVYAPVPETANQTVRDMVTNVWGMRLSGRYTSRPPKRCMSPLRCTRCESSSPAPTNAPVRATG